MTAQGVLDGETVLVTDTAEANRLHNKGFLGTPTSENQLRLSLVEAVHAIQVGRLEVPGFDADGLLAQAAGDGDRTEVDYLVYRDLRERGLVVRARGDTFLVWDRGQTPKQEPWFTCHPVAERTPWTASRLAQTIGQVLSIVDEDGAVTHYRVEAEAPHGDVPMRPLDPMSAVVLADRVLLTDPDLAAVLVPESMGTPHGDGVILSLTEAEALRRRGALDIPSLAEQAGRRQPHFPFTLPVYEALRSSGVVAKSGFRFGTHLRGYTTDPEKVHADWLFHCTAPDALLGWSDLSRGVRLAHGVRKRFLVAIAQTPVRFVHIAWFRP